MMPARLRRSFGAKLLAAELLVVLAGALTLLAVALSVGPILFRRHVRAALGYVPPDVSRHLDTAFNQSTLVAMGIAVAAAALTALAVSWFVSGRVTGTIRTLAVASTAVAQGSYGTRVPLAGDDEVGELARSFNEMSAMLEQTERRRRELLSDVSHELRTPLATIDGFVEGIADGVIAPGDRIWEAIRTEVARLTRLADDLQKVSRAEERQVDLRRRPTAPHALVDAAIGAMTPAYREKGVLLHGDVDNAGSDVVVDADRIGEVLTNLLENALRHTAPGGSVTVSAQQRDAGVEIAIADTGEGIAAEHLPRVFERFYRADRARDRASGGSGIGLAIAKALVEAHGGTITAESAGVGKGATFRLHLPD